MRYFVINIHEMKGGGAAKPPRAKGELTFGKLAAAVVFRAARRLNNRRKKIKSGKALK